MKEQCQNIDCNKQADFVILDRLETDQYVSETFSCEQHLGNLIGHHASLEVTKDADEVWEVRPLVAVAA